ncbi:uncharacterized protein LOC134263129 [Saccostrea cucullata]|uniref:uncharacterized protein LOC134263129 n=1 Tax=Saccostrea cuccullata TaxID=36930 RepID=UPI002ED19612
MSVLVSLLLTCSFLYVGIWGAAVNTNNEDSGSTTEAVTTTHHGNHLHVTREPSVFGSAYFKYDHYSHLMAYKDETYTCYILAIHPDDRHLAHTESGLLSLEVRMLTLAINATEPYSHDDLEARSKHLANMCPQNYALISLN